MNTLICFRVKIAAGRSDGHAAGAGSGASDPWPWAPSPRPSSAWVPSAAVESGAEEFGTAVASGGARKDFLGGDSEVEDEV